MTQHKNHRRDGRSHQDNGPTWEGGPPNSGCNSTHVARARKGWKRIKSRSERRTGHTTPKWHGRPAGGRPDQEDNADTGEQDHVADD